MVQWQRASSQAVFTTTSQAVLTYHRCPTKLSYEIVPQKRLKNRPTNLFHRIVPQKVTWNKSNLSRDCGSKTPVPWGTIHITLVLWGTIHITLVPWGTFHITLVPWGTIHITLVPWGTIQWLDKHSKIQDGTMQRVLAKDTQLTSSDCPIFIIPSIPTLHCLNSF